MFSFPFGYVSYKALLIFQPTWIFGKKRMILPFSMDSSHLKACRMVLECWLTEGFCFLIFFSSGGLIPTKILMYVVREFLKKIKNCVLSGKIFMTSDEGCYMHFLQHIRRNHSNFSNSLCVKGHHFYCCLPTNILIKRVTFEPKDCILLRPGKKMNISLDKKDNVTLKSDKLMFDSVEINGPNLASSMFYKKIN